MVQQLENETGKTSLEKSPGFTSLIRGGPGNQHHILQRGIAFDQAADAMPSMTGMCQSMMAML
jgi:hypothetical protein